MTIKTRAAAWRLAPRDAFIGWSCEQRERNLPLVIDIPRFLILPWVRVSKLGSHIRSLIRRRLPEDWTARNAGALRDVSRSAAPRWLGLPRIGMGMRRPDKGARSL